MAKRRVMLYFGSFNPIHKGHLQLAERVVELGLCDELIMVVSPHNPLKSAVDLAPELERFNMAEIACGGSKYSDRIKASLIEFMLPKPSYTINTLRYLSEEYGSQMEFSILMGGDLVQELDKWRNYEVILKNYNIYVYPREGVVVDKFLDQVTILYDVPMFDYSSTEVREALQAQGDVSQMLDPKVVKHIADIGLYIK
ncbi:MAG: nicotinate (nicotinamide) nucleotide adenylyltransferase [Rikenellaceae bacterium]